MIRPGEFGRYWLPVILYCGAIFLQSSFPVPAGLPSLPHLDKAVHAVIYGGLAVLFCRALRRRPAFRDRMGKVGWLSFGATVLYGLSDELHQSLVPGRSAEAFDLLADAAGALVGIWLFARLHAGRGQKKPGGPGCGD